MKTMILAAGLGTRLRPLTETIAKPMIPVVNKPVMEHVIELLARQGFNNLYANVHYRADDVINHFGNGSRWNVDLKYSREDTLAGTAGGLKRLESFFRDGTFVVFSSDLLTDIDLGPLIAFHKERRALATIALTRVEEPSNYGVVKLDGSGRITAFQEKPSNDEAVSNLASCGIYIFEPEILDYIPAEEFYDFGTDLFPQLFVAGLPLYGYEHDNYWLDIGRLDNYQNGNFDALTGKINIQPPGINVADGIWVGSDTEIHNSAEITGPLCIGDNCLIQKNTRIIGPVVIGNNNIINEGTFLQQTIKMPNGHVEENLNIVGDIIGEPERIESSCP